MIVFFCLWCFDLLEMQARTSCDLVLELALVGALSCSDDSYSFLQWNLNTPRKPSGRLFHSDPSDSHLQLVHHVIEGRDSGSHRGCYFQTCP